VATSTTEGPRRIGDLTRSEAWRLAALVLLILVVGGLTLTLKVSGPETTIGDEARFGAEARTSLTHAGIPDTVSGSVAFSVRTVGVHTTSDLAGGPKTDQPGPAAHFLAMPFVRSLGNRVGLWTFALVVNLGAVLLAGWAAFRAAGPAVGGWVVAGGLLSANLSTGDVTSALNVSLVVLPSFAAIVIAWGFARGDVLMMPVLAAVASFVVQTHIGYGLTPALVAAAATVMVVARPTSRRLVERRHLAWTGVVLAVAWALPLVDQFFGSGNLGRLITLRFPGAGLSGAWAGLGSILRMPPMVRQQGAYGASPQPAVLVLAALALVWMVRSRRRVAPHLELLVIALFVVCGALITAFLSPPGEPAPYHLHWIGLTVGFLTTAAGTALIQSQPIRSRSPWLSVAVLFVIAATAVPLVASRNPSSNARLTMAATRSLADQLRTRLDPEVRWNITSRGGYTAEAIANGVAAHLTDAGFAIRQSQDGGPTDRSLVVVGGTVDPGPRARKLVQYGRSTASRVPARIDRFVRAHQPLRLLHPDRADVVFLLDGRADSICPTDPVLSGRSLRELETDALAGMYGHGQVAAPVLPPNLRNGLDDWMGDQPYAVYELTAPSRATRTAFSSVDCTTN
jgi:hypothetical protein